mmetsp:Transcript_24950/g.25166  ORF Transcript_24950/g.25166 Transcript_24950/m.25166 type:complete len:148 (-) Transcript_24950:194-637(-)
MMFDPIYIIYQIISLQCFYYFSFCSILALLHMIFGHSISMDHLFTPRYINLLHVGGWVDCAAVLFSSFIGAWLLSIIVERSKKCVDFTFTLYFIHIAVCACYQQFPLAWEWWIVHVISSVSMASIGELLCARKELQDIPLYNPVFSA